MVTWCSVGLVQDYMLQYTVNLNVINNGLPFFDTDGLHDAMYLVGGKAWHYTKCITLYHMLGPSARWQHLHGFYCCYG